MQYTLKRLGFLKARDNGVYPLKVEPSYVVFVNERRSVVARDNGVWFRPVAPDEDLAKIECALKNEAYTKISQEACLEFIKGECSNLTTQ